MVAQVFVHVLPTDSILFYRKARLCAKTAPLHVSKRALPFAAKMDYHFILLPNDSFLRCQEGSSFSSHNDSLVWCQKGSSLNYEDGNQRLVCVLPNHISLKKPGIATRPLCKLQLGQIPYSRKFLLVQIFAKMPFPFQKKFFAVLIFAFSTSYLPHPFIVARPMEDERCPVGEGRTSSAGLK